MSQEQLQRLASAFRHGWPACKKVGIKFGSGRRFGQCAAKGHSRGPGLIQHRALRAAQRSRSVRECRYSRGTWGAPSSQLPSVGASRGVDASKALTVTRMRHLGWAILATAVTFRVLCFGESSADRDEDEAPGVRHPPGCRHFWSFVFCMRIISADN